MWHLRNDSIAQADSGLSQLVCESFDLIGIHVVFEPGLCDRAGQIADGMGLDLAMGDDRGASISDSGRLPEDSRDAPVGGFGLGSVGIRARRYSPSG